MKSNNKNHIARSDNIEKFARLYKNLAPRTLKEYLNIISLIERDKLEIHSKSRYLQVRSVLKKCEKIGIELDYMLVEWTKRSDKIKSTIMNKVISQSQLEEILENVPKTNKGKELNLAIQISYYGGLRLSEVLSLKEESIRFLSNGSIKLTFIGKGDKDRYSYLPKKLGEKLENFYGLSIDIAYVETTFRRIIKKLGIKTTFHGLRHSFAVNMRDKANMKLEKLQDLLGHKSIETTRRYLHTNEELTEEMKSMGY